MFKRINNWHLSILVAIVSIFSLVLIQQYVLASWEDPSSLPGAISDNTLVVNPLDDDLQLDGYNILGTDINIGDSQITTSKINVDEIG